MEISDRIFTTYSYSDEWIKKLKNAPQLNEEQIRLLDLEYGILLVK